MAGYSKKAQLKHERVYRALSEMVRTGETATIEGVEVILNIKGRGFRTFDFPGTEFTGSDAMTQYEAAEYITTQ